MSTEIANKIAVVFEIPAELMAQIFMKAKDMETRNSVILELGMRIYQALKKGSPPDAQSIFSSPTSVLQGMTKTQIEDFAVFVKKQYALTNLPPKP